VFFEVLINLGPFMIQMWSSFIELLMKQDQCGFSQSIRLYVPYMGRKVYA